MLYGDFGAYYNLAVLKRVAIIIDTITIACLMSTYIYIYVLFYNLSMQCLVFCSYNSKRYSNDWTNLLLIMHCD